MPNTQQLTIITQLATHTHTHTYTVPWWQQSAQDGTLLGKHQWLAPQFVIAPRDQLTLRKHK